MGKERFEVFGKIIKDNEDIPALLDNYLATVRLNEFNDKVKELEQELAELKEKLSKVTQFETPHIERFALVRYLAQKNKPYKIVNCYDCYRDKDYKIHYCFYNVKSMNFKLIEVFATEQEAQAKLRSLKDVYNRT